MRRITGPLENQIESEICSKLTNARATGTGPKRPFLHNPSDEKKRKRCNLPENLSRFCRAKCKLR